MRRISLFVSVFVLAASSLLAQKSWIVDQKSGPGTHFTTLSAALLAASDGDTILVRAGHYVGGTTSKALRIIGGGQVFVAQLTVLDLPARKGFTLRSVTLQATANVGQLFVLSRNQGLVHLDDVHADVGQLRLALDIVDCKAVTIANSSFKGGPGLKCNGSTVTVSNTDLVGSNGSNRMMKQPPLCNYTPSSPAAELVSSTVLLNGVRAAGGDSDTWNPLCGSKVPPSPAIRATNTALLITGDWTSGYAAGKNLGRPSYNVSAVVGFGGNFLFDNSVTFWPAGSASSYSGFANSHRRRLPSLVATAFQSGHFIGTDLFSQTGHLAVLLVALPTHPLIVPGVGQLWLDLGTVLVVDAGVQGASQHRLVTVPFPPTPALRGAALAFQAISGTTQSVVLSTPAVVVLPQ